MNKFLLPIILSLVILSLESCFDPPVYPNTPDISFNRIDFIQAEGPDSLILTFNFTDGDGDIGLIEDDVTPPFHQFNYVLDSNARFEFNSTVGEDIVTNSSVRFVEFGDAGDKSPYYLVSTYGTLVGTYSEDDIVLPSYSCSDYVFVDDLDGDTVGADKTDTVLISPNIYLNNIIIKLLRKRNGQLEDITQAFSPDACSPPFNSRIPIFDIENLGRPLEGTISYPMISSGFLSNFLNDSIVIEFYIYDRALNRSNVVTSPAFTLPGLLGIN